MAQAKYDAFLLVSFGGPERPEDVIPFLENVLRGRSVPRERMLAVAEHYYHFGGRSPINDQNRALIGALRAEFDQTGLDLPIYWGNRNWRPLLVDTVRQMHGDGVRSALAFATSAFSSYSGCRQYREDLLRAIAEVGPDAPRIEKLRLFYNHPLFIEANAERLRRAVSEEAPDSPVLFTAHSIPVSMAQGSEYVAQLQETSRLTAEAAGVRAWRLVYQSRSGPPGQPWLEPDILDALRQEHGSGTRAVVIHPIGFLSDHMEVLYDLDTEARQLCEQLGISMTRAGTVGTHPAAVDMIRELVEERTRGVTPRAVGAHGPRLECPPGCCPIPARPVRT